ncbi:MAG: DUF4339 domain-containing protein [Flavobacteriales bacterium]|nr:DUF4339 domain-containing protein [Flavobacteriales bacterium]MBX2960195.1 DUF4339 domain-containing protein [Flavobacteriales bacterium]
MKKYFIYSDEKQEGPFSIDELKLKKLSKETKVWFEGINDWTTIENVVELKGIINSMPPPIVTPPHIDSTKSNSISEKKSKKRGWIVFLLLLLFVLVVTGGYVATKAYKNHQQEVKTDYYVKNIRKYVTASTSNYTYREIGGIKDLSITVENNTPYLIDEVLVRVTYLKTSGDFFKEEILKFSNMNWSERRTIKAPDSDRGTKIDYEIISIKCYSLEMY